MIGRFIVKYVRYWNKYNEEVFDTFDEAYSRYRELKQGGYEVVQFRKEYILDLTYEVEDKYKGEIK